ncbi:MAG: S1C family serine protease [Acidimicrobiia bacterium]|nr:S1C family serine protease [Acidimicrobiia bacterium]
MLAGVQDTIREVGDKVGAAVVGVGRRHHVGSGVVVDVNTVLTNAHNIHNRQVVITFADGRTETGSVAGIDGDGDLAVVEVDTGDVTPVEWSAAGVGLGSPVVGLANPGGRGLRVTVGYVSGLDRTFRGPRGRRISGSIEHTAPLLPGSSGGPILDESGALLGVNTNRLGEGFYLAITADAALRNKVQQLAKGETPPRRYMGVSVVPSRIAHKMRRAVGLPDVAGVLVRGVSPDGPADAAGICEGDLIVRVGETQIADVDDLHDALDAAPVDEAFRVVVVRGTDEVEVAVTIS